MGSSLLSQIDFSRHNPPEPSSPSAYCRCRALRAPLSTCLEASLEAALRKQGSKSAPRTAKKPIDEVGSRRWPWSRHGRGPSEMFGGFVSRLSQLTFLRQVSPNESSLAKFQRFIFLFFTLIPHPLFRLPPHFLSLFPLFTNSTFCERAAC